MQGMRPLIQGTINGRPAQFEVDSGAFYNTLATESAAKFGLKLRHLPFGMDVEGSNGRAKASLTTLKSFSLAGYLGGEIIHKVDFVVVGSAGVDGPADGAIGQNYLSYHHSDTEYDLANGVVRLFVDQGCQNAMLAYWHGALPVGVIHVLGNDNNENVVGHVLLNGHRISVLFDTGAPESVLNLRTAKGVGISPEGGNTVDAGLIGGVAVRRREAWVGHFDSLDLGGEVIKNSRLLVSDLGDLDADLLLGADFFLSHRVLFSVSQNRVYFTYNGGPVFALGDVKRDLNVAKAAPLRDFPGAKPAKQVDAADLKRRAMALANRHEFTEALAMFDTVIAREPGNADNYLQRGLAHLGNGQPALALSDVDQALTLQPDLVQARMIRGAIRLGSGNDKGARHDFDVAVRFAPHGHGIRLVVAHAYVVAHRYDEGIAELDTWIEANPKSDQLPFALTQRCFARALANEELTVALADCKSALQKVHSDSRMLSHLGLVYLRLGKYRQSVREYKASIRLQPKSAWTRYGLGLAEDRGGLKSESAKSIQSALAIDPGVAKAYRKIGLVLL